MRKMYRRGLPVLIIATLALGACSNNSNEAMNEMDTPPINYVEDGDSLDLEEDLNGADGEGKEEEPAEGTEPDNGLDDATAEVVEREVYLIDANGLVVPQTIEVPNVDGVLRQSLEYLVEGGPVSELLPNGFKAVLPAGTEVNVNLKDGVATADFSEEFKEYDPKMEKKVLEAVTWTLTQFESVESVKIWINGYEQKTMPQAGTPIGDGVSRLDGINIETGSLANLVNTEDITLYFLAQNGDYTYYVPVTRRVNVDEENPYLTAMNELLSGPLPQSRLLTDFRTGVELLDEPMIEDGKVTLNFNDAILSELQTTAVSETVINMLALTLTDLEQVEEVALQVNGSDQVLMETGNLIETVSRPADINYYKY
ncbi:hypothetical protein BTS2_1030 [Bacillus sp. TS-2]|nr:hypothetical protein BTS2_1030 [Bacillus sp. TS-2]